MTLKHMTYTCRVNESSLFYQTQLSRDFPYFHFRTGTDPVSKTLCYLFFIWDRNLWIQSVCLLCYSSFEQHNHCESWCGCNIALICCDLIAGPNCYLCAGKVVLNVNQFRVITQYYPNFPLPYKYHKNAEWQKWLLVQQRI